jgi:hypothetical protein
VKAVTRARVVSVDAADDGRPYGLVCREGAEAPHFVCTGSRYRHDSAQIGLPESTRQALGAAPGDEVGILPF